MEHIVPESQQSYYDQWHFSPAVVYSGVAFLSGVTGINPDGTFAADAVEQFTQLFDNIAVVLTEAGIGWSDVIEMTSYHTNIDELDAFIAVRNRYLAEPWPAWSAIGCTALALPEARAEVRVIARTDQPD